MKLLFFYSFLLLLLIFKIQSIGISKFFFGGITMSIYNYDIMVMVVELSFACAICVWHLLLSLLVLVLIYLLASSSSSSYWHIMWCGKSNFRHRRGRLASCCHRRYTNADKKMKSSALSNIFTNVILMHSARAYTFSSCSAPFDANQHLFFAKSAKNRQVCIFKHFFDVTEEEKLQRMSLINKINRQNEYAQQYGNVITVHGIFSIAS